MLNIYNPKGEMRYTVRITLKQLDFTKYFDVEFICDYKGHSILQHAVAVWLNELRNNKISEIELKNDNGKTLILEAFFPNNDENPFYETDQEHMLKEAIISLEIIKCVPYEDRNAVKIIQGK